MGRRYYCDYCDRSFQDNMHNRKKHLNGVQHHRAKKAWYDYFRDERQQREDYVDRKLPGRSIEEWLSRREKKQTALGSQGDLKDKEDSEEGQEESDIPQQLLSIPNLPPSLRPPPPGGWKVRVNTEWG
ncbi:Zinc finger matrin-type protein 5 [Liparis tanakae]|uniref:Zinc finger matrin-type protein 5 n=1 Tax=Liparis tanakae TaxID=230148 RepID=A0A4Z2ITF0_9TELE|nr:Zinc finger matrin-type protein 5 [Liparis tanakae]